jgi:hypothetical protein
MRCNEPTPQRLKQAGLSTCDHHINNIEKGVEIDEAVKFLKAFIDESAKKDPKAIAYLLRGIKLLWETSL